MSECETSEQKTEAKPGGWHGSGACHGGVTSVPGVGNSSFTLQNFLRFAVSSD